MIQAGKFPLSLRHHGEVINIRQARPEDEAAFRGIDAATWTTSVSPAPPPRKLYESCGFIATSTTS
jgi:hypothetical protein